jgi:hypothetical protein
MNAENLTFATVHVPIQELLESTAQTFVLKDASASMDLFEQLTTAT